MEQDLIVQQQVEPPESPTLVPPSITIPNIPDIPVPTPNPPLPSTIPISEVPFLGSPPTIPDIPILTPDPPPPPPPPTIPGIPGPISFTPLPPRPPLPPPPPPPPIDPLTGEAVHRFWDEQTQSHFFTASDAEFSDRQNNPTRYRYEGVEFNTPSPDNTGALPVYRFENQQTGSFFYTLQSPDEITNQFSVLETDGIAFYAFSETTAPADAIPVYRFFNENASASTGTPVHFFTGTEENKDNVIANVPGFTFEGPGWYAFES